MPLISKSFRQAIAHPCLWDEGCCRLGLRGNDVRERNKERGNVRHVRSPLAVQVVAFYCCRAFALLADVCANGGLLGLQLFGTAHAINETGLLTRGPGEVIGIETIARKVGNNPFVVLLLCLVKAPVGHEIF